MKNQEMRIKQHTALSFAVQLMTNEYPEKFYFAEKINGSIKENTIFITGNLEIFSPEVYEKIIDVNGEKIKYKIILKPLTKVQSNLTTY